MLIIGFVICILTISTSITTIQVISNKKSDSNEITGFSEEQLNELKDFLKQENTYQSDSIKQTSNNEKIENSNTAGTGRNKLRFLRQAYIEAESEEYITVRTPFTHSYLNGPIFGKTCIKWSFKEKNDDKIRVYTEWEDHAGDVPTPVGDVSFYCKRVWFHDWEENNQHWNYNTKLGGVVDYLWVYGS